MESIKPVRESDGPSEDDRDISPARKQQKAKQKRKASTISLKDSGKTKNTGGKGRKSLAQTSQEMVDALAFMKTYNVKSSNNHLSTFTEHDENSDDGGLHLTKLTLDEKNEAANLPADVLNKQRPSWSQESEERNEILEDRLAHDSELDVTGIMNLSSMNITDDDLPAIIQRAFCGGRKKCIGLILRDNAITSEGVRMIVDAVLAARSSLKYLSFSNNTDIGDTGIEHLVRLLQKSRSITFLSVPNTGMTDHGVRLLADVLCETDPDASPPPPLEKLYISFNKLITDESLETILHLLDQNQTLKLLSVEHCSLSDKARKRLRQISSKTKKKKFSLSE